MKSQKALQTLSRLIADAYSQIVLCPLEEEPALLLSTGRQSPESFFEACRLVFGLNRNKAFETVCIHVAESCESLLYALQHGMAGNSADSLIASAENQVAAIGLLAEHTPMDSISDQAMLYSLVSSARLCLKSIQACRRQRIKT